MPRALFVFPVPGASFLGRVPPIRFSSKLGKCLQLDNFVAEFVIGWLYNDGASLYYSHFKSI